MSSRTRRIHWHTLALLGNIIMWTGLCAYTQLSPFYHLSDIMHRRKKQGIKVSLQRWNMKHVVYQLFVVYIISTMNMCFPWKKLISYNYNAPGYLLSINLDFHIRKAFYVLWQTFCNTLYHAFHILHVSAVLCVVWEIDKLQAKDWPPMLYGW